MRRAALLLVVLLAPAARAVEPAPESDGLEAQRALPTISGPRHTAFAGAYHGNGFHEDGLASGVRAAAALGVAW